MGPLLFPFMNVWKIALNSVLYPVCGSEAFFMFKVKFLFFYFPKSIWLFLHIIPNCFLSSLIIWCFQLLCSTSFSYTFVSAQACGLVGKLWVQPNGSPLCSSVEVLSRRVVVAGFLTMMMVASSETTGWQSDLGRERRDQSELLISVEILSTVAWFCSVLR